MNITFFIYSLSSGGAERVTSILANYWACKGWNVSIITVTDSVQDFYIIDSRVKRITLNLDVKSKNLIHAAIHNVKRIIRLKNILNQERPDVAIAMMTTANSLLAIAGYLAKVPVIGSERTYPPAMPLGRVWEYIRRKTYPLLDYMVAQTSESANWLVKNAPAKKIVVIANPLVFPMLNKGSSLNPRVFLSDTMSKKILLAVGRLGEEKGFDRLIDAFSNLSNQYDNWILVILGQGVLYNDLLNLIKQKGLIGKVFLPGAVGNISEWFSVANLYILTSRFEGFPNTLIEAMAHGLPVIAVDCKTGPRDIINDGVNGLLVPQNDRQALVYAISRLMDDTVLATQLSVNALVVREQFAVKRIAAKWEKLFQEIL